MSRALLLILVTSSVRVALVAALVGLVLFVMRAQAAAVSHAAWTVVLCAMLLMPVLPSMVQPVAVTVPLSQPDFGMLPAAELAPMLDPSPPTATDVSASFREHEGVPVLRVKRAAPVFPVVTWAGAVVITYFLVVTVFLGRLVASAWRVSRLERSADLLEIGGVAARVYASPLVYVPVTTGVLRPRVLVPACWRSWPAETRSAVLAHERAHIVRRDPLTHWLAYVNRSVFWFHPLAWWLERKLSATAEQACDAAAVSVIGDRQRYAQVLLEMADAVRRHGGRVAWVGVGIDGAGQLGRRIDQVLEGKEPGRLSRSRKAAIAFGCAAAIFVVIACRQQLAATPLKADPDVTARYAEQDAHEQLSKAVVAISAQQEAELEATWKKNPEDLGTLNTLLMVDLRFAYLPLLADWTYGTAEFEKQRDVSGATASWERSQRYAQDLLTLAPKFIQDPHYGDAIFEGNVVLALNTLRAGDVKGAVRYMRAAAKAPSLSDDFVYGGTYMWSHLADYLLKVGERQSVADFLEHAASINTLEEDRLRKDAAAIRAGRMPTSYQSMFR